jgi:glutathione synthase/RimK-type ligase-like ATP-grasp enzyme
VANNCDVLVIAARHTREVDGVIDKLRDRGLSVMRLAICQYPESKEITWSPDRAARAFGGPRVAWLCDLSGYSTESTLVGLSRAVSLAECQSFIEGSLLAIGAHWLNPPATVYVASLKVFQLAVARTLGIQAPETCVTNAPEEARKFIARHQSVVAKSLATGFITYGGQSYKFFTRRVLQNDEATIHALRFGPLIFQEEVIKSEEIRVVVVDNETFAMRLDLKAINSLEVDIRSLDYQSHQAMFSDCTDRHDLFEASRRIVKALGLAYGCLDWAVDRAGNAYFLECNPLGSFKWAEICTGLDISGSIASALHRRCWN